MAIDVDNLQSFSDADLLKLYRWGLAVGAAGQSRSISGRTVNFPAIKELRDTIAWLETRVQASTDGGLNIAYGQFEDPR